MLEAVRRWSARAPTTATGSAGRNHPWWVMWCANHHVSLDDSGV